jgi:hypothetical protein
MNIRQIKNHLNKHTIANQDAISDALISAECNRCQPQLVYGVPWTVTYHGAVGNGDGVYTLTEVQEIS